MKKRTVAQAARDYSRASRAYNLDCNLRLLKKPDAKRKGLQKRSQVAFNRFIAACEREAARIIKLYPPKT